MVDKNIVCNIEIKEIKGCMKLQKTTNRQICGQARPVACPKTSGDVFLVNKMIESNRYRVCATERALIVIFHFSFFQDTSMSIPTKNLVWNTRIYSRILSHIELCTVLYRIDLCIMTRGGPYSLETIYIVSQNWHRSGS